MNITDKQFDQERALYNLQNSLVQRCTFDGPADGESALKECRKLTVENCSFVLRYPLWHCRDFAVTNSVMQQPSRAPLWYCTNGKLDGCKLLSVKPLRECKNIALTNCEVQSEEVGWRCRRISFDSCAVTSPYFLFGSKNIFVQKLSLVGKYSFQYVQNVTVTNSILDTKDAFWHAKNVTVFNSVVKGEYLGWYSQNLTFVNCKISGTQPLCYCKNLKLINCTMEGCDLSFEYSAVHAQIDGDIVSVKNPLRGKITADSIGEIILGESLYNSRCKITERKGNRR